METTLKNGKAKISFNWIGIIVFLIIVVSNDTFFWGTNSNEILLSVPRYGSIFLCIYLLSKQRQIYLNAHREIQVIYCILMVFYLSSCIITKCSITITGIYAIYLTLAFLVCTRIRFDEFFNILENIIFFVSIYSLCFEIVAYALPSFASMFPLVKNYAGLDILNFGFSGILRTHINTKLIRNFGIFWEPGVFQIYINLALLYCIFFKKYLLKNRIIVYGFAIFITFSTTGYISYFLVLVIAVKCSKIKHSNKVMLYFLFGLLSITTQFIDADSALVSGVFGKIFDSRNGSTLARIASIIADIEIAKNHPLFGIGMSFVTEETQRIAREILGVYVNSNTNGMLYPLAAFGIPFEVIYIHGMIYFPNNFTNNKFDRLLILTLIVLIFISERLMSPFPYIMMFYGIIIKLSRKQVIQNKNEDNL